MHAGKACMYVFLNLFFYTDENLLYLLNQELVHGATLCIKFRMV